MTRFLTASAAILLSGLATTAMAQNSGKSGQPANNWGQQVKGCNSGGCYPGGEKRGEYVRGQAQDDEGPGYGAEIHDLAHPGKSAPKSMTHG
ncbi:hypothetical protein [Aquamicrobium soli]|uniref:Uncharacterized protein n=1 Tax=Aquamicrobium soli TaxID=1811518 RepID=A0ABV7K7G5_9HYPH